MITAVFSQTQFAGRCDNGSESSATWKYADGTCGDTAANATNRNWTQPADENFRVRFTIAETAGGTENNKAYKFQVNFNSYGWEDMSSVPGNPVILATSTGYTDGTDCVQRISSGTYITDNDGMDNGDGACGGTPDFVGSDKHEVEGCFIIDSTYSWDGATFEIRVVATTGIAISSWTNPTITVEQVTVSNISGTAASTYGGTSTLKGRGDVDGTAAVTFAGTSTLKGTGSIDGIIACVFAASGTIEDAAAGPVSQAPYFRLRKGWGRVKPPAGTAINYGHPISKGLVFCNMMDTMAGHITYDRVTNWKTITANSTMPIAEVGGMATTFNGTSDGLLLLGNPFHVLGSFSISAWVRSNSVSGWRTIICKGASSAENYYFQTNGTELVAGFYDGTTWRSATTTGAGLTTGKLYHLVCTFDVGTGWMTMWINGQRIYNSSFAYTPTTSGSTLYVGRTAGGEYWSGNILSLMVWRRPLSGREILDIYGGPYDIFNRPRIVEGVSIGAPSGDIAGIAESAYTVSGTLKGTGNVDGSATMTYTASGTLKGSGKLVGTSTVAYTPSGTLKGLGNIDGSCVVSYTASATSKGLGNIDGTISTIFSTEGVLKGLGNIDGTADSVYSLSGTLETPSSDIDGTATMTFGVTGTLKGLGSARGTASVTYTASGTVKGTGNVDGTANATYGGVSSLKGTGNIDGTVATIYTASGHITGTGNISGTAVTTYDLVGDLVEASGAVDGTATMSFGAFGHLNGLASISGTASMLYSGKWKLSYTAFRIEKLGHSFRIEELDDGFRIEEPGYFFRMDRLDGSFRIEETESELWSE